MGAVFAVAGCATTYASDPGPQRVAQLEESLRNKPPLERAVADYRAEMTRLAGEITAVVPGLPWSFTTDGWSSCDGDFIWTNAKRAHFVIGFEGPIPDDAWPRALAVVRNGAKRFGAEDEKVVKDDPGDHDVVITGPDDETFELGSQKSASLVARSDCRMHEK